jgi:fucose permease
VCNDLSGPIPVSGAYILAGPAICPVRSGNCFSWIFLGPIFPAGVVMCTNLLPKHLHVTALGTATAVAGIGGAVVPFAVGAIAQAKGAWVLQPIILALVAVISGLWLLLPRTEKARNA